MPSDIKKLEKMISKLTNEVQKLKVNEPKKAKLKERPTTIDVCTKKSQLMLFTVAELKSWLIAKKTEKLSGLLKEDLVKLTIKKLKAASKEASTAASSTSTGSSFEPEVSSSNLEEVDDLIEMSPESEREIASAGLLTQIMNLIAQATSK
jgi:hypothetical protein